MRPAAEIDDLITRRRIQSFLATPDAPHREVRGVLRALARDVGPAIIFGGMLRDLVRGGRRNFRSDIDVVVDSSHPGRLRSFLADLGPTQQNRFGGYRCQVGKWDMDVWLLSETWAIANGHVKANSWRDLVGTTFFDWDAIAYNTVTAELHTLPRYYERIASRSIDINLLENPNPAGAVGRTLGWLKKSDARLAPRLARYVVAQVDAGPQEIWNRIAGWPRASELTYSFLTGVAHQLVAHMAEFPSRPFPHSAVQLSLPISFESGSAAPVACRALVRGDSFDAVPATQLAPSLQREGRWAVCPGAAWSDLASGNESATATLPYRSHDGHQCLDTWGRSLAVGAHPARAPRTRQRSPR